VAHSTPPISRYRCIFKAAQGRQRQTFGHRYAGAILPTFAWKSWLTSPTR
jgi:hypothetical protein